jgi:rod shape-determining protein MreC
MARAAQLGGRFDAVVFAACVLAALVLSGLPPHMRDPVAAAMRRTLVAPLIGMQRGAERWRTAWVESERQTLQLDSAGMFRMKAKSLEMENDRLRRLLGLGNRLEWGFVPAEALHTEGRTEDVITSLTLTAGTSRGVAQYSPVVTVEGVVGLVQTVDPKLSLAILYSHPDFRVSAMAEDTSVFGIVYPHLDVASTRMAERYLLELRNVPFRSSIAIGTPVYSSGIGGAWPRGVLIGTVIDSIAATERWSRTYLIRPAVNPAHVTSVMILTPQRAGQGVGKVWAVAPSSESSKPATDSSAAVATDSALKAAARRDSLRRVSARRDSIRRDSVRRDSVRRDSLRRDSLRDTTRPPAP